MHFRDSILTQDSQESVQQAGFQSKPSTCSTGDELMLSEMAELGAPVQGRNDLQEQVDVPAGRSVLKPSISANGWLSDEAMKSGKKLNPKFKKTPEARVSEGKMDFQKQSGAVTGVWDRKENVLYSQLSIVGENTFVEIMTSRGRRTEWRVKNEPGSLAFSR